MAKGFFEKLNDYKAEKPKPKKANHKRLSLATYVC